MVGGETMPVDRDQDLLHSLGSRIREVREARGQTQERVAEQLGVEVETQSRYESGTRTISLHVLVRTADVLQVDPAYLLLGDEAQEPVVVRFYESSQWYVVEMLGSGTEIVRRRFGVNADIELSGIDLQFRGDSVSFSARGVADLGETGPPKTALGVAVFSFGEIGYKVSFNSMGASKVEGS